MSTKILRATKIRIYPTQEQAAFFNRSVWRRAFCV
ncbi:TPA: helix-turn-helix domain-containing protein [Vibrio parahaemolyticus]|nr:helix-turn-helix domain-containing protein [Vibrio parahaemolyticus]HCE2839717.1 helix-turn-helix domain-containing protein [Vibrio parahaemolyticus]HCE3387005.1 helix-turn-helix domain-containing protein [Vibrio parahaemolyticus]HCG5126675.1 helix-turn-helix domain-containing protein [Vibrio parahaemolyticus]HCG6499103.1 helix-turn-helix domain-containing protein [Vibrio parahaemolyticus]